MYFNLIAPADGHEREAAHERAEGPYAEHRWLWRFFPAAEGTTRDFLFRRLDVHGIPRFYVVSRRAPVPSGAAWSVQTREYAPRLLVGTRLHFDLRANPVVSRSRDGKSKRDDVVMQEKKRLLEARGLGRWQDWQGQGKPALYTLVRAACGAWLKSRAASLGFAVDEMCLAVYGYQRHAEKNGRLHFSTVDFSGDLTVTDPVAFGQALYAGVGHAKAFGCGLLLVRRLYLTN